MSNYTEQNQTFFNDDSIMIDKAEILAGPLGEDLSGEGPLFPFLQELSSESPMKGDVTTHNDRLKGFAYNKLLGHKLAYKDLTISNQSVKQEPIQIFEKDGILHEYTPVAIKTQNSGIVAQALVCAKTQEIKVLFRGTSSAASTFADLENGGTGAESFAEDADIILEQVNNLVGKIGANKLTVTGHSLGGALSQLFIQRFTEAQAQNLGLRKNGKQSIPSHSRNHLSSIAELEGFVYNSAGIAQKNVNKAKYALQNLKALRKEFKMGMHYFLVGGDAVQQTGNASIFSDISKELADVSLLKLQGSHQGKGYPVAMASAAIGATIGTVGGPVGTVLGGIGGGIVGGALGAVPYLKATHCNSYFNEIHKPLDVGYVLATNETKAGQKFIHKEVGKKSWVLNNPITSTIQKGLLAAGRAMNKLVIKPIIGLFAPKNTKATESSLLKETRAVTLERQQLIASHEPHDAPALWLTRSQKSASIIALDELNDTHFNMADESRIWDALPCNKPLLFGGVDANDLKERQTSLRDVSKKVVKNEEPSKKPWFKRLF